MYNSATIEEVLQNEQVGAKKINYIAVFMRCRCTCEASNVNSVDMYRSMDHM